MGRSSPEPCVHRVGLHRLAVFTVCCTFPLIFIGGLVTSKGAGLAVPDWPTSYGYNMFLFPPSMWVGNIFYEHTHRLLASSVGLLTTILAVWLWRKEPRRWLRWLGVIAFGGVLFQGILGGLRVVLLQRELGIFHGCLAQVFFCLLISIAIFTSRWWKRVETKRDPRAASLRTLGLVTTIVVFLQLALGASMRHTDSGLAIPDFPLAYGQWIPPTDAETLRAINQVRTYRLDLEPVSAEQIWIHFAHRVGAVAVSLCVLALVALIFKRFRDRGELLPLGAVLFVLLVLQAFLGAWTVLSRKAADVATAHVAVGALLLATSFVITLLSYKLFLPQRGERGVAAPVLPRSFPVKGGAKSSVLS